MLLPTMPDSVQEAIRYRKRALFGTGSGFYNLSKLVDCITVLNSFFPMFASDPVSLSLFLALAVVDNII